MTAPILLETIATEIAGCTACGLANGRHRTVPGEGPADTELLFIGEAPGWNENQQGRPFIGAAGRFLEELLASIGLSRQDVFIANVVKCWPPGNRDPQPAEIETCRPFLDRQVAAIQPLLVVTLGRHSMARWFPGVTIGRVHGTHAVVDGQPVFAMYHPAAALHQGSLRQTMLDDMQRIPPLLDRLRQERALRLQAAAAGPAIRQLSLFDEASKGTS